MPGNTVGQKTNGVGPAGFQKKSSYYLYNELESKSKRGQTANPYKGKNNQLTMRDVGI